MNIQNIILRQDNNQRLYDELLHQIQILNPTWHITLTWDTNHRTRSIETLNNRVKECMAGFERAALGRNWFRKHLAFVMVAEKHADGTLHAHIVIAAPGMTQEQMHNLFHMSEKSYMSAWPEIYITPITDKTPAYILKQIRTDWTGTMNTDTWMTSPILLNLNHKKKRHRVKGYQKHNIKVSHTVGEALGC